MLKHGTNLSLKKTEKTMLKGCHVVIHRAFIFCLVIGNNHNSNN